MFDDDDGMAFAARLFPDGHSSPLKPDGSPMTKDDLILLPLGIATVRGMIPSEILAECREKAAEASMKPRRYAISSGQEIIIPWRSCTVWTKLLAWRSASWVPASNQATPRPKISTRNLPCLNKSC
jgi:hypothetical protein